MKPTYGLEYALFFGVPSNKIELWKGSSRWAFPFSSRADGETHFRHWVETLQRWKCATQTSPISEDHSTRWRSDVAGIRIELFSRPIEIRIPIAWDAFDAFLRTFHRRDYWPGQPAELRTGYDSPIDESDIRSNLWWRLGELSGRHGGTHSGRVDIALAPGAGVAPDVYYYAAQRTNFMIGRDYFCAPPDLVVEVLSAPSRWLDRGPRMEVYRRAGIPHLWLVEPALETVEVYALCSAYECVGTYRSGDTFTCDLFPGDKIDVDRLFRTQSKRWPEPEVPEDRPEPIPEWLLPPEMEVGLEYFFVLGHPERRWEFWNSKARSVLAFGSPTEARARLDFFVHEACCWESLPRPRVSQLAEDVEQTEVGKFQLTRNGRLVFLDLRIDDERHREILATWADSSAWDWGD